MLEKLSKTSDFSPNDRAILKHVNEMIKETGGPLRDIDVDQINDDEVEEFLEGQMENGGKEESQEMED